MRRPMTDWIRTKSKLHNNYDNILIHASEYSGSNDVSDGDMIMIMMP